MENGEWRMGNGEWGMGNEEWRMGNGEWGGMVTLRDDCRIETRRRNGK
jgi:hypothetical protein